MNEIKCPPFETIFEYLEGNLSEAQLGLLETHFQTCERCLASLAEARQLLELLRVSATLVVPAPVHQKGVALFRSWFQNRSRKEPKPPSFLKKLTAHLVLDNNLPPGGVSGLAAGLRSSSLVSNIGGKVRQFLYRFEELEIELDLQLRPAENPDQFVLLGQVFGLNEPIDRVELAFPSHNLPDFTVETQADETGSFQFSPLSSGEYNLQIYCGLNILTVESFRI